MRSEVPDISNRIDHFDKVRWDSGLADKFPNLGGEITRFDLRIISEQVLKAPATEGLPRLLDCPRRQGKPLCNLPLRLSVPRPDAVVVLLPLVEPDKTDRLYESR
jgi:hypothetical protein